MGESELSMKLLVDSEGKRVLFAEANKECVDFLFYILTLPVSTIIRLLGKEGMVGSLPNLYESVEGMNASYIQPNKTKDSLLKLPTAGYSIPLLSLQPPLRSSSIGRCSSQYDCNNMSNDPLVICPSCRGYNINTFMNYVTTSPAGVVQQAAAGGEAGGFVKGVVTYMIMDDLVVKPMFVISSITLLSHFNIKDLLTLEENVVTLGMKEAVELLKASLETDKVLTNVFLPQS